MFIVLPALLAALVDGLRVEFLVAAADLRRGVHCGVYVQVVIIVLVDIRALKVHRKL